MDSTSVIPVTDIRYNAAIHDFAMFDRIVPASTTREHVLGRDSALIRRIAVK